MKVFEIIFLIVIGLFGTINHIAAFNSSDIAIFTLPNFILLLYLCVKVFLLTTSSKNNSKRR